MQVQGLLAAAWGQRSSSLEADPVFVRAAHGPRRFPIVTPVLLWKARKARRVCRMRHVRFWPTN